MPGTPASVLADPLAAPGSPLEAVTAAASALARRTGVEARPDVSVVVPAYEEAESLPELAARIRAACDGAGLTYEVWIVDDGSGDATWSVVEDLTRRDGRIHGVRFRRNYGKSAALSVGFERARGRHVVTMDADLQDDPAEIPGLVAMMHEGGYDLVSGWKQTRHDPLSKTVPSKFFNGVTRMLSGIPLHDFNCGLKIYRREVVKAIHVYGEMHRYVPLLAKWEGYGAIGEKAVQHHPRQHGRSKFGIERFLRGFLDLVTVVFLTRFMSRPMHLFGMLGTVSFAIGVVTAAWISVDKLVFGQPIGDRPLLLFALALVVVGVQMFTTGLLGETIIRPHMESTQRYQVAEDTTRDVDA